MKKPQLRNIIRESIKGLMIEQQVGGELVRVRNCYNQNYSGGNQIGFGNVDFACVPAGTQLGDKIVLSQSSFYNYVGPGDAYVVEIGVIHPATGNNSCPNAQSITPLSGPCYTCCQYEDGTNALPQPGSSFGCCPSTPPPPPPPLNPGCTDPSATNYDATADGCEVNGVVDTNDTSCCMIQPGGGVTPTNVGPSMASNDTKFATLTPNPTNLKSKRMKNQRLKETIKKTIKEMMSGGMLNEAEYCNGAGQDPATHTNCHERGVGCLNMEDHFFGVMGQCVTCDPEWACVSVAPGGPTLGPTLDPGVRRGTKDPKFNDPNLMKMATRNMLTQTGEGCTEDSECQSPSEPNGCCEGGVCTTCGDYMMGEERLRKYYCFTCKGGFWGGNCVHNASTLADGRPGDCPSKAECEADCTRRGKFGSEEPSIDNMAHEAAINMLSEAEVCWFGRKNYANSGYTCVARGCNFRGPQMNPNGWADINDGAGYEFEAECNQWMAVQMTMPGGNPGTNNPTLYATNSVRSTDRPAGGGKISMDRMMREATKNILKND